MDEPRILIQEVKRGTWSEQRAETVFEMVAEVRDWFATSIYRCARQRFELCGPFFVLSK